MAANVENMFFSKVNAIGFEDERKVPWHGLGTPVMGALTSKEAIVTAGLDWEVRQTPSFIEVEGEKVETGSIVNYRNTDKKVLGTVTNRYKVVQNMEAFEFTDSLIGNDEVEVKYETAGSLDGGKKIWLLAQMPSQIVLGDEVEQYVLFANSHDGSSSIQVCNTPVRVVCQNTLNFALSNAKRMWSFFHKGDIESKLDEARKVLAMTKEYQEQFAKEAERLQAKKFTKQEVKDIIDKMFPIPDEDISQRKLTNILTVRDNLHTALNADDISQFGHSAWWFLNGVSDMVYHAPRLRRASEEANMKFALGGSVILDQAYSLVA